MNKLVIGFFLIICIIGTLFFISRKTDLHFGLALLDLIAAREDTLDQPYVPRPLKDPPSVMRGIYITSWIAGNEKRLKELVQLIKENNLNTIVVDIKDSSGYVSYSSLAAQVIKYETSEARISDLDAFVKKFHDENIYIIGRISVFQDPLFAEIRPDLALKSKKTGKAWKDRKGLSWLDAASSEVWDYNIEIAQELFVRGFDEVNFDYIRFPSDGNLLDIAYPVWDIKTGRNVALRSFFEYLRNALSGHRISADLFGLTTVSYDDLGIGQVIEDAFPYFDYIDAMIYPSHYARGFQGYNEPAKYPYEIVNYSMQRSIERLSQYITHSFSTHRADVDPLFKLRPWLQDFDLGTVYDKAEVEAQIRGVSDAFHDVLLASSSAPMFSGWLMWAPDNRYTSLK